MPCLPGWERLKAAPSRMCLRYTTRCCPRRNPNRRAWEQYRNTLPMDHPDRERAQAIIDSLPERNPAQQRGQEALTDWPRLAARTAIGVAEGAGGAMAGKTLGGLGGPKEGDLPRAETQAILAIMEQKRQQAQRAAATRARNKGGQALSVAVCFDCSPLPSAFFAKNPAQPFGNPDQHRDLCGDESSEHDIHANIDHALRYRQPKASDGQAHEQPGTYAEQDEIEPEPEV